MWVLRFPFLAKLAGHRWQEKGLSPVCVRMWLCTLLLCVARKGQTGQQNGLLGWPREELNGGTGWWESRTCGTTAASLPGARPLPASLTCRRREQSYFTKALKPDSSTRVRASDLHDELLLHVCCLGPCSSNPVLCMYLCGVIERCFILANYILFRYCFYPWYCDFGHDHSMKYERDFTRRRYREHKTN